MVRKRWFWFAATASAVLARLTAEAVTTNRTTKRQRERGESLVELALVLPVLLLILISILDLGRAVYAYHVVANCAREGARFGATAEINPTAVADVVRNTAVGLDTSQLSVTVTYPTNAVRVEVSYNFRLITPLVALAIGRQTLTLSSAATMYKGY
nr:pilus assembly protein [Chloroflexota bacterium]